MDCQANLFLRLLINLGTFVILVYIHFNFAITCIRRLKRQVYGTLQSALSNFVLEIKLLTCLFDSHQRETYHYTTMYIVKYIYTTEHTVRQVHQYRGKSGNKTIGTQRQSPYSSIYCNKTLAKKWPSSTLLFIVYSIYE